MSKWNPVAPTVLVADDDPAMRTYLGHVLKDAGYNVRIAMDIREAIHHLRLPGVSAAIVDMLFVNSNGKSGLDILRHIRSHPGTEEMPVLVFTGFPLNAEVTNDVSALRGELWHKPVDPAFLVQRLHDLLYQRSVAS
jgi:CheY-like chemotaxis protein